MAGKIKKSTIAELVKQNRELRACLEAWPAREIMMDYEKEWNERRQRALNLPEPEIDPEFFSS